jgi:hypothetical protein
LIELIAMRLAAEGGDVTVSKSADRLRRQLRFAHRNEIKRPQLASRALRLGIEGADRFERVAEEIEPHRRRRARRIEVEDAAAHGVVADVVDAARTAEAIGFEPQRERGHIDAVAGRGGKRGGGDESARRQTLGDGVDRRHQNARPFDGAAGASEARQGGHALGADRRIGRDTVVRLAIPGRKIKRLDLRRSESERVDEALGALAVARDESERRSPLFAWLGEGARQLGEEECVITLRRRGERDRAASGETARGDLGRGFGG